MSDNTLRKVIVDPNKMSGYMGADKFEAYFHQWGTRSHDTDSSTGFVTIAIVENVNTGQISTVDPYCIKFIENFEKEKGISAPIG